jgi:drug/metabolite transporter (DMT)-like permease
MLGLLFVGWGSSDVQTRPTLGLFLLLAGVVFLVGALMSYSTSKKYTRPEPEKEDT